MKIWMKLWQFLGGGMTIIPTHTSALSPWTIAFFPFMGCLLGGFSVFLSLLLPLPSYSQAVCIVGMMLLLSGALHVDGWADTFDALGGDCPSKRHAILEDPRLGVYGTTALVVLILLKVSLITHLLERGLWEGIVMMPMVSRWMVGFVLVMFRPAKEVGLFALLQKRVGWRDIVLGSLWMLLALGMLVYWRGVLSGGIVLSAMILALGSGLLFGLWQKRRLDGITGDTCGATMEVTEVVFVMSLLVLCFEIYTQHDPRFPLDCGSVIYLLALEHRAIYSSLLAF